MVSEVIRNDNVICEIDDSVPVLKHKWIRQPTSKEFRDGLLNILETYKKLKDQYTNLKWLADTQLLGELEEDDEKWLTTEWDHKLFDEAGVKVHAVILGPDLYTDYPMELFKMSSVRKYKEKGVKLEVFANEEKAYNWLLDN